MQKTEGGLEENALHQKNRTEMLQILRSENRQHHAGQRLHRPHRTERKRENQYC